jgi:hypothetical protein
MSKEPNRRIVTPEEYCKARDGFFAKHICCGNLLSSGITVCLKTDSEKLAEMWKANYPQHYLPYSTSCTYVVEVYSKGENIRLYNKENHRILITGSDYYGGVKFGYRVILADMLKQAVTMHSSALAINGKTVVITGPSGAGKNTTMNYLDQKHTGLFLWDDWGVINHDGWIPLPNEQSYHMSETSASAMVPGFKPFLMDTLEMYPRLCKQAGLICEPRTKPKYMVPLHLLRPTVRNTIAVGMVKAHSLVILTNDPDSTTVRKVDVEEAIEVFSKPAWSYAWECNVPFMNEHLMMNDDELVELKEQYRTLFKNIPNLIIANNNKREQDRQKFLEAVEKLVVEAI